MRLHEHFTHTAPWLQAVALELLTLEMYSRGDTPKDDFDTVLDGVVSWEARC